MDNILISTEAPPLLLEHPARMVTTFKGETARREDCRKIKGLYYIKGKDCFLVNKIWYKLDSGLIAYNYSTQEWFLLKDKTNDMICGIVDYADNRPKIGYFNSNPYLNVIVQYEGNRQPCISEELALKFARESPCKGIFIANRECSGNDLRIKNVNDNQQNTYNIEDNLDAFEHKIKLYNEYKTKIPPSILKYSQYLADTSFGAELECIRGYLPEHLQNRHGVIICRDGSLKDPVDGTQGPEYTTVPMTGAKGVHTLINLSKHIALRNDIDEHCAFHLHLGNLPTSRIFIVSLYRLCFMIQDDIFKMFPYYKNDEVKYAGKNKNYCQRLVKLFLLNQPDCEMNKEYYTNFVNDTYLRIYKHLLESRYPDNKFNRKTRKHPKDQKWDRHARYHWVNFINLITSQRNTVEFRIHTATTNPQKIVSWLFLCNAIVKTAIFRSNDIIKGHTLTLEDVMNFYKDFYKSKASETITRYLKEYYEMRCRYFERDFKRSDYLSKGEIEEDKSFIFPSSFFIDMFK